MMISPSLIRQNFLDVAVLFSLAFSACGPSAAPPTPSGYPPVTEHLSRQSGDIVPTAKKPQAELAKAFDDSAPLYWK